jgi:uncharacterized phosphosugar-binding protein
MTKDSPSVGQSASRDYLERVSQLIGELITTQRDAISAAAALFAAAIEKDGLIHVFGPGHSHIVAEEAFNRTGGLACISPIVDRTGGRAELVEGYAQAIIEGYELRRREVMVISSNSGVNPLPIEMAMLARERGLNVVAITSLEFSRSLPPRHTSGSRLFEIADVVLDNRCPAGDALVSVPGVPAKVGPGSSIASIALLNATIAATIERLSAGGREAPVLLSERLPGEFEHNNELKRRFASRVRAQFTAMLFY